jgi:hypothetical protein
MSYLIKYEDIRSAREQSSMQFNKTSEGIDNLKGSMTKLLDCRKFQGQSADCIKNYINEVHALLLASISTCISSFSQRLLLYCDNYYSIDSNKNAIIPEEPLRILIQEYGKSISNLETAHTNFGGKINAISDIYPIQNPSISKILDDIQEMKTKVENYKNDVEEHERTNKELSDVEELIVSLKSAIAEYANRTTSGPTTYKAGDCVNNQATVDLINNTMSAIKFSQDNSEAISIAQEHQQQIYVEIQAEARKVQGVWEVIGGALLITAGVVCIVATWGAATPVVVGGFVAGGGTVLFGASDVVTGVQDVYYGANNDITSGTFNDLIIDNVFQGNKQLYSFTKDAFSFTAGVFAGIGPVSKAQALTWRSGSVILGKELVGLGVDKGCEFLGDELNMSTSARFILNFAAGKLAGKGLDSLDENFNVSGLYTAASAFGGMSPEDARRYNQFMDNGSQAGFNDAELFGFNRLNEINALNSIDYYELRNLRQIEFNRISPISDNTPDVSLGGLRSTSNGINLPRVYDDGVEFSSFRDFMDPEEIARYDAYCEYKFFGEFVERAQTVGVDDDSIMSAFEAMRSGDYDRMASYFDTSSPPNGAYFWSGDGVKEQAAVIAQANGGTIMEQTPGGQVFDGWKGLDTMYTEWGNGSALDQKPIWEALSYKYASEVTGNVTYVHPSNYVGKVWKKVEKPELIRRMRTGFVTSISEVYTDGE